jgi:multiple sugar transport system substrate-binding protein
VRATGKATGKAIVAIGAAALVLTACGEDTGPPTLIWYINPDDGGQDELAAQCSEEADGAYQISTSLLPREAPGQREQLARRLAAQDTGIDMMSLDPVFIAEFAEAGWLTEIPSDVAEDVTDGIVPSAVEVSTWRDTLVAVPFWANTQLLWYRKSVAESAGLDPENEPVTWEQLIEAAQAEDTLLSVHGVREEAYAVWINALVLSAGGEIIENPDAEAAEVQLGLESEAGQQAAEIIGAIAREGLGGPGLSNQDEEGAMHQFNAEEAAFMVNWPFVWAATNGAVEEGNLDQEFLDDIGWAMYPAVAEGEDARPPYGGISIAISAYSRHPDEALEAAQCITTPENQAVYFANEGNPAAHVDAYEDSEVQEAFPMADVIRDSLEQAGLRPHTPYYNEVSEGLQSTWHPPTDVDPDTSPAEASTLITEVLRGERLL